MTPEETARVEIDANIATCLGSTGKSDPAKEQLIATTKPTSYSGARIAKAVGQLPNGADSLPHHYALLACPDDSDKKRTIDQRLAGAHISPLWFPEGQFEHIEDILRLLID